MRLLLISLVFFVVYFGLPGSTNAQIPPLRRLTVHHYDWIREKTKCRTIDPKKLSSSFLFQNFQKVSRLVNSTGSYTLSDITIKKSIVDNYEHHNHIHGYTYNCAHNTLYILKRIHHDSSAVLNVFDYNKNNGELILTKQVPNIFDGGQSIQLDWITNKIYWVTCNDRDQYSIKVTDTSFEKTDYVIENFEHFIYEVKIYPKEEGSQIFFISNDDIYWTYCSPGSTVNLVFESPKDEINPEQLAIDYELEELCWTYSSGTDNTTLLRCIDIAWSAPPLDVKDIVTKRSRDENINSFVTRELVVFSNEFYWIGKNLENKKRFLFYQAANENPVEVTELHSQLHYEFIFLNCPCTRDEVASSMGMSLMHTHVSKERTIFEG